MIDDDDISKKLKELDWDIQPRHDLWERISPELQQVHVAKVHSFPLRRLTTYTIAASIILALVSISLSVNLKLELDEANNRYASYQEYQREQIGVMEVQHQLVRTQLLSLLENNESKLDVDLVADIRDALVEIDIAANELKSGVLNRPENTDYPLMLAKTYQQESNILEMLNDTGSGNI